MRKTFVALTAIALVGSAAMFVLGPRLAGAQGGGTVEVEVKYNGAPVVEKLKVNKDTEKCGTETTIEKVVVGSNKGLANAVASAPNGMSDFDRLRPEFHSSGLNLSHVEHIID